MGRETRLHLPWDRRKRNHTGNKDEAPNPLKIATVSGYEPMQFAWCLEVIARDDLQRCPRWEVAFANERKDHRYYELVENTLHPEFDYGYFVIKDAFGQICAMQPFFLLDLDLLVGA